MTEQRPQASRAPTCVRRAVAALGLGLCLWLYLGLGGGIARAELIEVHQVAGGMECAECARNLRMEVLRLDGAIAAEASWNRRVLTARFRPDSRVTLEQIRAVVRRHHFSVGEAEIVVRGRIARSAAGSFRLRVAGSDDVYEAVAPAGLSGRQVAARLEELTRANGAAEVTMRGRLPGDAAAPSAAPPLWILEILPAAPAR